MNTKEFIEKANKKHNYKYDYSKSDYVNCRKKISIICPIHGEFQQYPNKHLIGCGCKKCGSVKEKMSIDKFIEKANKKHNYKYDYSLVSYENLRNKIEIVCPIHGEFQQQAFSHLNGSGCKKCKYENMSELFKQKRLEQFRKNHIKWIDSEKFNGKYDIKPITYLFQCEQCGLRFLDNFHTRVPVCRNCNPKQSGISKKEKQILKILKSFYNGTIIENDRSILNGKELDIYLPEEKIAIEFNGTFWHGFHRYVDDTFQCYAKKHLWKLNECFKHNLVIYYFDEIDFSSITVDSLKTLIEYPIKQVDFKKRYVKNGIELFDVKNEDEFIKDNGIIIFSQNLFKK